MTVRPFDDILALLQSFPQSEAAGSAPGLGRIGEIAAFVRGWRGGAGIARPIVALYAGSSGTDPQGVRGQLEAIAAGGAPVAAMVQGLGAGLEAFDLAIDRPSGDITRAASMSERECAATMAFGMEALAKQPDLLALAVLGDDAGVGAAAIACALFGGEAEDWLTGGAESVAAAVSRLAGPEPLEILRQVGGREIAAVAGAIVAARTQKVPAILDGYGACAAAAVLQAIAPDALDHCLAAHDGGGAGHARLLGRLGLKPLLHLGEVTEPGVGAVGAIALVKAAAAL